MVFAKAENRSLNSLEHILQSQIDYLWHILLQSLNLITQNSVWEKAQINLLRVYYVWKCINALNMRKCNVHDPLRKQL